MLKSLIAVFTFLQGLRIRFTYSKLLRLHDFFYFLSWDFLRRQAHIFANFIRICSSRSIQLHLNHSILLLLLKHSWKYNLTRYMENSTNVLQKFDELCFSYIWPSTCRHWQRSQSLCVPFLISGEKKALLRAQLIWPILDISFGVKWIIPGSVCFSPLTVNGAYHD